MLSYSGIVAAPIYLELVISAILTITRCRISLRMLVIAMLLCNVCTMIPQINVIDSCHSNHHSSLHCAPLYGDVLQNLGG